MITKQEQSLKQAQHQLKFDLLLLHQAINWDKDLDAWLTDIHTWLKPNGHFITSILCDRSNINWLKQLDKNGITLPTMYNTEQITNKLSKNGFASTVICENTLSTKIQKRDIIKFIKYSGLHLLPYKNMGQSINIKKIIKSLPEINEINFLIIYSKKTNPGKKAHFI